MSESNVLSITRGDKHSFKVAVTDKDDAHFSLVGYTSLKFTAKDVLSKDDADADIGITGVMNAINDWEIDFNLTPTDTKIEVKVYTYDVQISDGGVNVHTVIKEETLYITPEVTKDP